MYPFGLNPRAQGGAQTVATYEPREIHVYPKTRHPAGISIAPGTGDLDIGTVLGESTADGLFRPVLRTTVQATAIAAGGTAQTINLKAGTGAMFKIGQTVSAMKSDGTNVQALGTIQQINGDVVTVQDDLTAALNAGDYFYVSDGSQTATVILTEPIADDPVNVRNTTGDFGGVFYLDQIIGLDPIAIKDFGARTIQGLNFLIIPV